MRGYIGVGIGLFYVMIVFGLILAKFAGHIAWPWWIVLSPLWGPVAIIVVLALVVIACFTNDTANGRNPFQ